MMKTPRWINKISFKVAIIITALIVVLLVAVNFLVVSRGESVFDDVYHVFTNQPIPPPERIPFQTPYGIRWFSFSRIPTGEPLTAREHFKNKFQVSLLLVGIGALAAAIGIGVLTSRTITNPLNKLRKGMQKLRSSNYTNRLQETESEEFNGIIHEFNDLSAELQRVEELRKNVISDASHELRTPLSSLVMQLEGIEDGVIQVDKERIQQLRVQVDRLHKLVNGLQEYAYLRSQAVHINKQEVRLRVFAEKVASDFHAALRDANISLLVDIPEDLSVQADEVLLDRVLHNLLENAIRYSHAEHVVISANARELRVSDDGVGISDAHLKDIFERFFRIEKSRNRETGGMGLGLSIVKEIVETHGWHIIARKPASGKGVEFVITFHSA